MNQNLLMRLKFKDIIRSLDMFTEPRPGGDNEFN
jgi:hypothetical protein